MRDAKLYRENHKFLNQEIDFYDEKIVLGAIWQVEETNELYIKCLNTKGYFVNIPLLKILKQNRIYKLL
jgi:hypothetical protein